MRSDFTKLLPVVLTQEEFDSRAAELAATLQEIDSLILDRKAAASAFKERIESAQANADRLVTIVAKRQEMREVNCTERLHTDARIVEIIRTDTYEIVGTRGPTADDIQESLLPLSEIEPVDDERPEPSESDAGDAGEGQ